MAELGYNITTLAPVVGVSRATLSAFFGGAAPSYMMMRKMQRVLKLSATEAGDIFFSGDLCTA
jgi:predicted transcriptional regulator